MTSALERSRQVYQALDLPDNSTVEAVKKAYKELALRFHPDKNLDDPSATERFQAVNAAYSILSNPERKAAYDATLWAASPLAASPSSATFQRHHSSLFDELNTFRAARRAASSSGRPTTSAAGAGAGAGGVNGPKEPKESQYTPEQTEFFRQRARERERELYKRLEREKEEARQRDLDKYKQAQEDRLREDERRRREQVSSSAAAISAKASSSKGPAAASKSPPTTSSTPGRPPAATPSTPSARCRSESPTAAGASPHDDGTLNRHRDRIERIRREKERQEEIRRAEQERFFDKKLQEARTKEERRHRLAEDETREYYAKEQGLLVGQETAERVQLVEAEELMERRWILNASRRVESAYSLKVRQEHLENVMEDARQHLVDRWSKTVSVLHLLHREGVARVSIVTGLKAAVEKLALLHQLERQRLRRNGVERLRLLQACELSAEERVVAVQRRDFALLLTRFDEGRHRIMLRVREMHERAVFARRCLDSVQGIMVGGVLAQTRRAVEAEESAARSVLVVEGSEHTHRVVLADAQSREHTEIIRMRGKSMCDLVLRAEARGADAKAKALAYRRRDQLDMSKMAVEIERLHEELHNAKEELELLQASSAAATFSGTRQMHAPLPPMMCDQGTMTVAAPAGPTDKGESSRDLIAMLCAENRRLSASNAALLDEMRGLNQSRAVHTKNGASLHNMPQVLHVHQLSTGGSAAGEVHAAAMENDEPQLAPTKPAAAAAGGPLLSPLPLSSSELPGSSPPSSSSRKFMMMSPIGLASSGGDHHPQLQTHPHPQAAPGAAQASSSIGQQVASPSRSRAWGSPRPQ